MSTKKDIRDVYHEETGLIRDPVYRPGMGRFSYGSRAETSDGLYIREKNEKSVNDPVNGPQHFLLDAKKLSNLKRGEIKINVGKGMSPYNLNQQVMLDPTYSKPLRAVITGIEQKGKRFILTVKLAEGGDL